MKRYLAFLVLFFAAFGLCGQNPMDAETAMKMYDPGSGQFKIPKGTKLTGFLQDTVHNGNLTVYAKGVTQYAYVRIAAGFSLEKGKPVSIIVGDHFLPITEQAAAIEPQLPSPPPPAKAEAKKKKS